MKLGSKLKIFIGGFDDSVTKDIVVNYFTKFGKVTGVVLPETPKDIKFGFVTFADQECIDKVVAQEVHEVSPLISFTSCY